jgi:DNA repair photolyase
MPNVNYIQSKSVLNRFDGPHPLYRIEAALNPYFGCNAGCLYCPYTVKNKIAVKTNFLPMLEAKLKAQKDILHIGIGTTCEPYCEEEMKFRLTRSAI